MRKADGFFSAEGLSFNSVAAGKRHPTHLRGLPRATWPRFSRLCSPSRWASPARARVSARARPNSSFVPRQRPFKALGSLLAPWGSGIRGRNRTANVANVYYRYLISQVNILPLLIFPQTKTFVREGCGTTNQRMLASQNIATGYGQLFR